MDRKLWVNRFSAVDGAKAPWPCPTCGQRTLTVVPTTVHTHEAKESEQYRNHEAWEPEWIDSRFVCILQCTCNEFISVTGRQGVEEGIPRESNDHEGDPQVEFENYYEPLFFHPALRLIDIPRHVPNDVREKLAQSFALFWFDLEACSNRIRTCIEKLLDHLEGNQTALSAAKKRVRLKLHVRIERFGKSGKPLSEHLMAVKWLGNAGSHSAPIKRDDILDAYEIMEYVLRELYDQPAKRISRISEAINKTRRPRSASQK